MIDFFTQIEVMVIAREETVSPAYSKPCDQDCWHTGL